jgi:hypothetical protein
MYSVGTALPRYVILTNRKRAIVALVHSVAFLGIALFGMVSVVRPLAASSPASAWTMVGIYAAVTSALAALTAVTGHWRERLYFACCATSATFGLLRQILGDPPMHFAVYLRVAMLSCAVAVGLGIVRAHRRQAAAALAGDWGKKIPGQDMPGPGERIVQVKTKLFRR